MIKTKKCIKCFEPFPATPEFFYRNSNYRSSGLGSVCKPCNRTNSYTARRDLVAQQLANKPLAERVKEHYAMVCNRRQSSQ